MVSTERPARTAVTEQPSAEMTDDEALRLDLRGDPLDGLVDRVGRLRQEMEDARLRARAYAREHGEDAPEVAEWRWQPEAAESP